MAIFRQFIYLNLYFLCSLSDAILKMPELHFSIDSFYFWNIHRFKKLNALILMDLKVKRRLHLDNTVAAGLFVTSLGLPLVDGVYVGFFVASAQCVSS